MNKKTQKTGIVGEPTEETRFVSYRADSSLIGRIDGYMCEQCTAKYGTAVNFKYCPFCKREITDYVYREV